MRIIILSSLAASSIIATFMMVSRLPQSETYHDFADTLKNVSDLYDLNSIMR